MSEDFAFNANQYFDFKQFGDDDKVDSYFEENHEIEPIIISDEVITIVDESIEQSDDEDMGFYTPMAKQDIAATVYMKTKMRRSKSLENLALAIDDAEEAETRHLSEKIDELKLSNNNNCEGQIHPRKTTNLTKMKPRGISQENLNKLAQPKHQRFASSENLLNNDKDAYVCMAEAVSRFHRTTPQRFRSQSARNQPAIVDKTKMQLTRPHSPKLATKIRARPVDLPTQEERELLEFEQAKNFKIKTHNPPNRRVLNGPLKPQICKKAPTRPEPFHLSEPAKKTVLPTSNEKKFVFHAAPVPKSMYSPCKLKAVKSKEIIVPETPDFVRKYNQTHQNSRGSGRKEPPNSPKVFKPRRTQILPFSFEKRDEQIIKKKEELIQKVLEEEKKAREFHANPVPKKILNSKHSSFESGLSGTSVHDDKKNPPSAPVFKARPATVLKAKPFEPKRAEIGPIQVEEFQFQTEQRRTERLKFEEGVKQKEEALNSLKEEIRQRDLAMEEEEIRRFKKEAEFKAQPVRKFKGVNVQPSNKVTEPVSPKFHYVERIKNKENLANN